jgi:hypothetical protein
VPEPDPDAWRGSTSRSYHSAESVSRRAMGAS